MAEMDEIDEKNFLCDRILKLTFELFNLNKAYTEQKLKLTEAHMKCASQVSQEAYDKLLASAKDADEKFHKEMNKRLAQQRLHDKNLKNLRDSLKEERRKNDELRKELKNLRK